MDRQVTRKMYFSCFYTLLTPFQSEEQILSSSSLFLILLTEHKAFNSSLDPFPLANNPTQNHQTHRPFSLFHGIVFRTRARIDTPRKTKIFLVFSLSFFIVFFHCSLFSFSDEEKFPNPHEIFFCFTQNCAWQSLSAPSSIMAEWRARETKP